jgi:NADH:ubiquinone oxidoreductase subunit E
MPETYDAIDFGGNKENPVNQKQKKSSTDNWPQVRRHSEAVLPKEVVQLIRDVLKNAPHPTSHLIRVLHAVQNHYGYLGADHLGAVAQLLQVPAARVSGVATFYHYFRLLPRGTFLINVCMGTACYVKGAEALVGRFNQELGISYGETTEDGLFSLQATRCLGTCGLAPVVTVNEEVHAKVTPNQVPALIERYSARGSK